MLLGLYVSVLCFVYWYIYQQRELKRFYEKAEAEAREQKAVEKEVDFTNTLNLQ